VAAVLDWEIQKGLAEVVDMVDEIHLLAAERELLLVKEAVEWFRPLANDPKQLLKVEYNMLKKRISVIRRCNTSRGKERETDSLPGEGRQCLLQTLETEKIEMIHRMKTYSRSISPEAAATPNSERSESSKRTTKEAGGLIFTKEPAALLADLADKRLEMSNFIFSKSLGKSRHLRRQNSTVFPTLHSAILFGTEKEAQSSITSTDRAAELDDFFKRTIAHVAAERGRVHLLTATLIDQRKLLDTRDAWNLTPLMIAVICGHLNCCKLLIDAGFDRYARDSKMRHLLSIAVKSGHYPIVEYLVEDLKFPVDDSSGGRLCSPIHDAIESENLQICKLLIDFGADVYTPFNDKTPQDLAFEKGGIWQLITNKIDSLNENQGAAASVHAGYPDGFASQSNIANGIDHTVHLQHTPDFQPYPPHSSNSNTASYHAASNPNPQHFSYPWTQDRQWP